MIINDMGYDISTFSFCWIYKQGIQVQVYFANGIVRRISVIVH